MLSRIALSRVTPKRRRSRYRASSGTIEQAEVETIEGSRSRILPKHSSPYRAAARSREKSEYDMAMVTVASP